MPVRLVHLASDLALRAPVEKVASAGCWSCVCLASAVALHVPVGIAAVYGVLTNVVAELVVWSQCGSCRKLPDRGAKAGLPALPRSLVAGSRLVVERGRWSGDSYASCPVSRASPPESRGSRP